jgi:phenol 2-monooxygenase
MNVSMMDSYNLSWKLVHSLHGLAPKTPKSGATDVLATFGRERLTVAQQLIEFDSKFSSMFSGQIGAADETINSLTHEQFLKVFSDGSGFTSGCGIEYPTSLLVQAAAADANNYPVTGKDYLQGALKPGRRLLDVVVRRYADANIRHLQDGTAAPSAIVQVLLADNNLFSRLPIDGTLSSSRPCKQ